MDNIAVWLAHDRVHGDLSPFNILYTEGRLVVIDFPQAVDPRMAPAARRLLERDVANVCKYFTRHGIEADAAGIARDLWERFTYGALTP
jgi:RIO kinase 1